MKQKTRTIEKEVDYLTNPKPRYVSLVNHGANQTPFAVVKHVKENAMSNAKPKIKLIKMKKSGLAPKLGGIRKLVLDQKYYKDEAAVTKYLTDNNWEDFVIVAKSGFFEVSGKDVSDSQFVSVKMVQVEQGVVGYYGEYTGDVTNATIVDPAAAKVAKSVEGAAEGEAGAGEAAAEGAEGAAEADPAAEGTTEGEANADEGVEGEEQTTEQKTAELVSKFDCWGAMLSNDNSLKGVLEDGMSDGIPPGMDEIFMSVYTAMSNVLKDESADKGALIAKIGADFAEVVTLVSAVFDAIIASGENDDVMKSEKMQKFVAKMNEGIAKYATKSATKTEPAAVTIPKEFTDMIANVCNSVKEVVSSVAEIKKSSSDMGEALNSLSTEVATLKSKAPLKKGVMLDAPNAETAAATETAQQKLSNRVRNDSFGIYA